MTASQPQRPADVMVPGYIALAVPEEIQEQLKVVLKPHYPVFKGNHVTLRLGAKNPSVETDSFIGQFQNAQIEIYGVADDDLAVQCFLVRVNGAEADQAGRPYHLTWSINPDMDVPAVYNRNKKPSKAKSMHAAFVAAQPEFRTMWEHTMPFYLSATFYPEKTAVSGPLPQSSPV